MHNIKHEIRNGKLFIEIELSDNAFAFAPLSSKGKTRLLASTSGYIPLFTGDGTATGLALSLYVVTSRGAP